MNSNIKEELQITIIKEQVDRFAVLKRCPLYSLRYSQAQIQ